MLAYAYLKDQGRSAATGASELDGLIRLIGDGEGHQEVGIARSKRPLLYHLHRQQHRLGSAGRLSGSGGVRSCPRGRGGVRCWPG